MAKPVLYHDIDGVIFGDYDGHFQIRPSIKTWLTWAHEHFEVVWLTAWDKPEIKMLLSILYCEKMLNTLQAPAGIQIGDWHRFVSKEEYLGSLKKQGKLPVDWFWIDDNRPTDGILLRNGLDLWRCLMVDPKGADSLLSVKSHLTTTQIFA